MYSQKVPYYLDPFIKNYLFRLSCFNNLKNSLRFIYSYVDILSALYYNHYSIMYLRIYI